MKLTKGDYFFIPSLILAIWFALTGMIWPYYAALIVAYPAAIVSFILWRAGKKTDSKPKRYKIIKYILIAGLACSLAALVLLLMYN